MAISLGRVVVLSHKNIKLHCYTVKENHIGSTVSKILGNTADIHTSYRHIKEMIIPFPLYEV